MTKLDPDGPLPSFDELPIDKNDTKRPVILVASWTWVSQGAVKRDLLGLTKPQSPSIMRSFGNVLFQF